MSAEASSGSRSAAEDYDVPLADTYKNAMGLLDKLESGELFPTSGEFKRVHFECLELLTKCLERVQQLGLFSPNETWDDIQTPDIRYLNLNFYVAKVLEKTPINPSKMSVQSRINVLNLAIHRYLQFLYDTMDLKLTLKPEHGPRVPLTTWVSIGSLLPQGKYGPFSLKEFDAIKNDRRTKTENNTRLRAAGKSLNLSKTNVPVNDEERIRIVEADRLALHWYSTWDSLFGVLGELDLLSASSVAFGGPTLSENVTRYVPAALLPKLIEQWNSANGDTFNDLRVRMDTKMDEDLSNKVEATHTAQDGKLVGDNGKVRRPFVIMPKGDMNRTKVSQSVFGTGQRLPTVSVEELIEKELANQAKPQVTRNELREGLEEDSDEASDILTMKARRWDDFTENNPKGSGNTLNLG